MKEINLLLWAHRVIFSLSYISMLNAICDWPIRLFSQELVLEPREQAHWIRNIEYHSHVDVFVYSVGLLSVSFV